MAWEDELVAEWNARQKKKYDDAAFLSRPVDRTASNAEEKWTEFRDAIARWAMSINDAAGRDILAVDYVTSHDLEIERETGGGLKMSYNGVARIIHSSYTHNLEWIPDYEVEVFRQGHSNQMRFVVSEDRRAIDPDEEAKMLLRRLLSS